jgi:hypothetical protein
MNSISAFLILLLAPQFTFGQSDSWDNLRKLHRGQKIEVVDMKLKSFQGTFISYSQDMVSLHVGSNDISIPRSDVVRVTNREQHRFRDAFIGAGLSAALGAGIGGAISATADKSEVQYGTGVGLLVGMAAGAALGATVPSSETLYRIASDKKP